MERGNVTKDRTPPSFETYREMMMFVYKVRSLMSPIFEYFSNLPLSLQHGRDSLKQAVHLKNREVLKELLRAGLDTDIEQVVVRHNFSLFLKSLCYF